VRTIIAQDLGIMTWPSLIVKSSFRNRRRSLSTIASVTVSFLLLTILVGMWYAFYTVKGAGPSAYRFMTRNKVSLFFPVLEVARGKLRMLPGVEAVTQLNWFGGSYKEGGAANFFSQYGTDPNAVFNVYNEWAVDPEQVAAFQHDPAGAAVSRKLAERYGWRLGDRILLRGTITPINLDLHVRAIYDPHGASLDALLFNWDHVLDSYPQYRGIQGTFVTRVRSPEQVALAVKAIDEQFHNSPLPTKSETESAYQLENLSMLGNVKLFILSVSLAVTFAMLLVCANTSAMSIRERVREIAILRTIGYSRYEVLGLLLAESAVLSVLGSLMGIVLGLAVAGMGATFPSGRILGAVHLSPMMVLMILMLAVAVAVVSSFVSAFQASRGNIINGLRYVG
jgi:putative ABC transport system permease protein